MSMQRRGSCVILTATFHLLHKETNAKAHEDCGQNNKLPIICRFILQGINPAIGITQQLNFQDTETHTISNNLMVSKNLANYSTFQSDQRCPLSIQTYFFISVLHVTLMCFMLQWPH